MSVGGLPADHPEFDAMAEWYDFDYDRRMRKDLPFYLARAREGGGPVLELGAGTGRVTEILARAGFDVTAVDLSSAMLARAEARRVRMARAGGGKVRLVHADMADPGVRGRFGTVLVPFRSFNHLYTIDRQLAALRSIRRRLSDDGIAVIDLWNPDPAELRDLAGKIQVAYERKHPRRGTRVVQRFKVECDAPAQMAYLDYWWDEYRGKRRVSRTHAPMRWRWFGRWEFVHLLARAGLRSVRVHGDFREGPYRADSEDLIFVAARD